MPHRAMHRCWLEIDLDALESNYQFLTNRLPDDTGIIAVIKGDSYGLGAPMFLTLFRDKPNIKGFAVATVDEAIEARIFCADKFVLVFGYTPPEYAGELAAHDITVTIPTLDYAKALNDSAAKAGVTVRAQIEIDTGMCRFGLLARHPDEQARAIADIAEMRALSHLQIDGIYTHFATGGAPEEEQTDKQFELFLALLDTLEGKDITFAHVHCSNSAATFFHPDKRLPLVRTGCAFYGLRANWPDRELPGHKQTTQWKTQIIQIKSCVPGDLIGYGPYPVEHPMTIAVISCGYADGVPACTKELAGPLVHGVEAPIISVSMDQMMIDITHIPDAYVGQVITYAGEDAGVWRDMEDVAELLDVHPGDFYTRIPRRVPRVYMKDGNVVAAQTLLNPLGGLDG